MAGAAQDAGPEVGVEVRQSATGRPGPSGRCASWTAASRSGRRAPNEKNTCRPGCGRQRRHRAGQEQLARRPRCRAGRWRPRRSSRPGRRAAAGAGRARPARRGPRCGRPACRSRPARRGRCRPRPAGGSPRRARSRRRRPRWPREIRSSSPSSRIRCPARACAACIRSTRRSLVARRCSASGPARAGPRGRRRLPAPARASSRRHGAGITTPRPAQAGQVASRSGWPAVTAARPLGGQPRPAGCGRRRRAGAARCRPRRRWARAARPAG